MKIMSVSDDRPYNSYRAVSPDTDVGIRGSGTPVILDLVNLGDPSTL